MTDPTSAPSEAFANELIRASWEGCDGGDIIQETALKHGLIERVPFDPAIHTDNTGSCAAGDPWLVFTDALASQPVPAVGVTTAQMIRASKAYDECPADHITALRAAVEAALVPVPAVAVKGLEWTGPNVNGEYHTKRSLRSLVAYSMYPRTNGFWLTEIGIPVDNLEQGYEAAQADYEARIRSALAPAIQAVPEPATAYQRAEESLCTCGAAGSGEGHTHWCDWQSSEWRKWGDAFDAPAQAVPDMVLVPREPTEAMLNAFAGISEQRSRYIWEAMLLAASLPVAGDPICRKCATQEHGSAPLSENCICGNFPALMAAAPDMLAALEAAEELYSKGLMAASNELIDSVRDLRRAAIAKAQS
ncbi:MAG: hypothetical protein EOS10_22550 [Mesorhizobium sp.]|uniref:hypothetical protein n=1 Tax=Mesorhizobium sp. TaxID=1871066 RepID=UPI000FE96563|nr:hypothetical protein [Mesorhizobium sp.]RWO29625.1 MAG: hypothetical protein EOS10_22550 [Mesorhizobium sp.]